MRRPALLATSALLALSLPSAPSAAQAPSALPGLVRVSVTPNPFSPNGDGRRDRARIEVGPPASGRVEIRVLDAAGRTRRTWSRQAAGAVPAVVISWRGRAGGRRLPDGVYTIRATAVLLPGVAADVPAVTRGEATVVLDTRSPRISGARVTPTRLVEGREVSFRFTAHDRATRMLARVSVMEAAGRLERRKLVVGGGRTRMEWRSRHRLYPGNYRMILRLRDDAGNVTRPRTLPWRVERAAKPGAFRRLPAGRRVALTFDDCHRPDAWSRILSTLARARVKATFFCPGTMVHAHPDLARRTVREGHTPAGHAWDHASLAGRGAAFTGTRARSDARAWWRVARATSAPYMRPPYGAYDASVLRGAGANWHPRVILWDVDPQDWRSPGISAIVSRVLSRVRPGSIVLLHTMEQTAAALPSILSGLRSRGLRPVSLPVLFRAAGKA